MTNQNKNGEHNRGADGSNGGGGCEQPHHHTIGQLVSSVSYNICFLVVLSRF